MIWDDEFPGFGLRVFAPKSMHQMRNTSGSGASCRLEILPLGAPRARAEGGNVAAARLVILVVTVILAATATRIVGP